MSDFWQAFLLIIEVFLFLAYLIVLFQIVTDLVRDKALRGPVKAGWVLALVLFPLIAGLVYLIVRGGGMAARREEAMAASLERTRQYMQAVASNRSPSRRIADAKALLDSGQITQGDFETTKTAALTTWPTTTTIGR